MGARIYINGRFLTQEFTGVQLYAYNLCLELLDAQKNFVLLVPHNTSVPAPFAEHHQFVKPFTGNFWEQYSLPRFIAKMKNATLVNLCNAAPLARIHQIVTIHDLAVFQNKKWFHPIMANWYAFMIPKIIKNAQKIITISQSMAKEINETFPSSVTKTSIIPNKFLPAKESPKVPTGLPYDSYFLMVGSMNPRKNIEFITQAFATLKQNLVVVGGGSTHFTEVTKTSNSNIWYTGYIATEELYGLYQNAHALIMPSHYEGFGIPLLEAFHFSIPVLCSDIPAFREVAQNAALYFNPKSVASFIAQLHNLKLNTTMLIEEGNKRLTFYNSTNRVEQFNTLMS
jgi:glycosyltransferase involved in cell wall biosynthesis